MHALGLSLNTHLPRPSVVSEKLKFSRTGSNDRVMSQTAYKMRPWGRYQGKVQVPPNPLIVAGCVDNRALYTLRGELVSDKVAREIAKASRFSIGQIFISVPTNNMLAKFPVGLVHVIQALHREAAELFVLVVYPVEGILDLHTVELGVEPFSDA